MSEQATAPAPAQATTPAIVSVSDMIGNVSRNTGIQADPVVETPAVRFTKGPLPMSEAGAGEAAPVADPIAPVVEAPVAETIEPSGELSLDDGAITLTAQRNADGTFKTKLDPNEKIDFVIKSVIDTLTGKPKVYTKSLPELARMAKDSIAMQQTVAESKKIIPEVEYYRAEVPKWQGHVQSLTEQLEQQKELNRELLSADDEVVIQHRERYKAEMSPEKQLARIQAERKAETDAAALSARRTQHEKVANSFMQSRIAPSLKAAEDAGLSKHTVIGLFTDVTTDLMHNGVIPPANWPEMERRVTTPDGPFQSAIRAESAKRTTDTDAVRKAREAADAEQRRAQAVVNEAGRSMTPVGRGAMGDAPNLPKPKNTREVIDRLISGRPLPTTVQHATG